MSFVANKTRPPVAIPSFCFGNVFLIPRWKGKRGKGSLLWWCAPTQRTAASKEKKTFITWKWKLNDLCEMYSSALKRIAKNSRRNFLNTGYGGCLCVCACCDFRKYRECHVQHFIDFKWSKDTFGFTALHSEGLLHTYIFYVRLMRLSVV